MSDCTFAGKLDREFGYLAEVDRNELRCVVSKPSNIKGRRSAGVALDNNLGAGTLNV